MAEAEAVGALVRGCGVRPPTLRLGELEGVVAQLERHGACIVVVNKSEGADCEAFCRDARLFEGRGGLRACSDAIPIDGSYFIHASDDFHVHSDAPAYGYRTPDVVAMFCAAAATTGGETFLVDTHAMLAALGASPATAWLPRALRTRAVDMSMAEVPGSGEGCVGPVAIVTQSGELAVRRVPINDSYRPEVTMQPVAGASTADAATTARMLALFHAACDAAATAAPRFRLLPGQALLLANYRVMHGREPFEGPRLLHRAWIWTARCNGVPESIQGSFVGTDTVSSPILPPTPLLTHHHARAFTSASCS